MAGGAVLSKVEGVKNASGRLRGTLAATIAQPVTGFGGDDATLLKFHGVYQGADRDSQTERKQAKLEKAHQFMVRARIPGGRLTAQQYLDLDALADRAGDGTLRVTTRQGVQYHGVLKGDLKPAIASINETLLTTLAACGDVVRNVTTTPAPIRDTVHRQLEADAKRLSLRLLPRSRGYIETWLDGEKLEDAGQEVEPLYGATYLPRKFKMGLATPEDNSIDVLTNDLGIVAIFEGQELQGYNLALGGGLGMTHNKPKTFPRLATPVAFVPPELLDDAVEAVVRLHRDYGDRLDRKHARLKYVIEEKGAAWAKATLEADLGRTLEDPRPVARFEIPDHLGRRPQGDGLWYLGVPLASGRIADRDGVLLRTGLRSVIERWRLDPVLTPGQDIILTNIEAESLADIENELRGFGVQLAADLTPVRRWALACPALPTCALALTEAERVREPMIDSIETVLRRHDLIDERLSIRITGCPNGCARPYSGDIGIVGRMPDFYALYVGGDFEGTRLNFKLLDKVHYDDIASTLEPLFALFKEERQKREGFGDFCQRVGAERLLAALTPREFASSAAE
jgi:sulfite reductase (ferredoxin)